ncbi:hypothetical protein CALVIDRAFT_562471 [Calocera viscosa TUFC12733]|uniref:Uncharacterized protein n=1 Tax=Calocera viscosa (strain TUFC12733) TaxID=1330018 RepID=A0A167NU62_CALVF|nr:hypothetical protein CALVIDRAFT_562471 [Calocera viscosa TUFC12733]
MSDPRTPLPPRLPPLPLLTPSRSSPSLLPNPPPSPASTPKARALNASGRLLSPSALGDPISTPSWRTGQLLSPLFPRSPSGPTHAQRGERSILLSPATHLALMRKRISSPVHLAAPFGSHSPP